MTDMTCWSCANVQILDDGFPRCGLGFDKPALAADCEAFVYEPGSDEDVEAEGGAA